MFMSLAETNGCNWQAERKIFLQLNRITKEKDLQYRILQIFHLQNFFNLLLFLIQFTSMRYSARLLLPAQAHYYKELSSIMC